MASASTSGSPLTPRDTVVDGSIITRKDTRHDRAVDTDEKNDKGEPTTESDSSVQEQVKEFKEGGYGWYVNVQFGLGGTLEPKYIYMVVI